VIWRIRSRSLRLTCWADVGVADPWKRCGLVSGGESQVVLPYQQSCRWMWVRRDGPPTKGPRMGSAVLALVRRSARVVVFVAMVL
jgi:hypothetical protein